MGHFFKVGTNISGEKGFMDEMDENGTSYKNWIVNRDRHTINIYIIQYHTGPNNSDILSWSCLNTYGNAFAPNYDMPNNQYFTTKTTGLGSYTLELISAPPRDIESSMLILSSRFNPTKRYPLDLNFYWGLPTT